MSLSQSSVSLGSRCMNSTNFVNPGIESEDAETLDTED